MSSRSSVWRCYCFCCFSPRTISDGSRLRLWHFCSLHISVVAHLFLQEILESAQNLIVVDSSSSSGDVCDGLKEYYCAQLKATDAAYSIFHSFSLAQNPGPGSWCLSSDHSCRGQEKTYLIGLSTTAHDCCCHRNCQAWADCDLWICHGCSMRWSNPMKVVDLVPTFASSW